MRHPWVIWPALLATTLVSISPARSDDDPELLIRSARYKATQSVDPLRSGSIRTRKGFDGHLWVRPLINGKDVGWFMFDTGKTGMAIDPEVARAAGLTSAGEGEIYGVGGTTRGERFRMTSFELGPFRAVDFEAEAMHPMPLPPGPAAGERPIGVVGSYVLRELVTVIDLAREAIALYAPSVFRGSDVDWLPTRMRPDVPAVEVRVEGRPIWLLLDTGMPGAISLFDPETAQRLGLAPTDNGPRVTAMGGDGHPLELTMMSAKTVALGGEVRRNVRVAVPVRRMAPARPALQGLLGNQLLAGRTLVIDGPRRRAGLIGH